MNEIAKSLLALIIAATIAWVALTKTGYIDNFLNLEILNYENTDDSETPHSQPSSLQDNIGIPAAGKPVIYLYPQEKQNIQVQLEYQGKLIADYPDYNEEIKGWDVIAYPDGKIINSADNQEYSYLFWEGDSEEKINWDLSKGFIVKWQDTKEFLQDKLVKLGLTPKEYNEFIVYRFPLMQNNKYNLIHFANEQYTNTAPLTITPKPDSMLRVFMVYKPLEEAIEIKEQEIEHFVRKWFTVIEWGGTKAD